MARAFTILSKNEQISFDSPPVFNAYARKHFFYLSSALQIRLKQINSPKNKVLFMVAFGYFKASKQFHKNLYDKDIDYVAKQLDINPNNIFQSNYDRATQQRHRQIILEFFGYTSFDAAARRFISKEVTLCARSQVRPRKLLEQLVELLEKKSIEIPRYQTLAKLISEGFNTHKETLINQVQRLLSQPDRLLLEMLLTTQTTDNASQVERYRLTLLKRFSQSTKPKMIQQNIEDLRCLKELYQIAAPILTKLDLNHEGIRQYATAVIKSEIFQVSRRAQNDQMLYLIAFIAHQYYRLQDLLTDIMLGIVTSILNTAEKEYHEMYYQLRKSRAQHTEQLVEDTDNLVNMRNKVKTIYLNETLSSEEKLSKIWRAINLTKAKETLLLNNVAHVKADSQATLGDEGLMGLLEEQSRKLQNRVSDIVKHLTFSSDSSNSHLLKAIESYQQKEGKITNKAPMAYMTEKERLHVRTDENKIRISLYKALLFSHIAQSVKAGTINLDNSYKYRSLDDYMISKSTWKKDKIGLLKQLNLMPIKDYSTVASSLSNELEAQFYHTNIRLINDNNAFVKPNGIGGYRLSYARHVAEVEELPPPELFPKNKCISLSEVLSTVDHVTGFSNAFEHSQPKYLKRKPPQRVFYAGIIADGCQIGTHRIARVSNNINDSTVETAVNWYFSLENLQKASDKIIEMTIKMELPSIYQDDPDLIHTSSDGQKYNVTHESSNAGYSFKYHGRSKGAAEYSFIDARSLFPHSNVISSAEREAHYIIDGLIHNDVIKSDIHSSDTHGYSEMIFAVTHLLGFSFAPRIKNVQKQYLYAFKPRGYYKNKGYQILPNARINEKLIEDNWDDVLRFIATIKMKEATASQLFKRLNSYSRDNPLYLALKEFGKIIKTIYILNYIDDPDLREAVHKQLNKGESGNRLARALAVGSPEYSQVTKEDQERAEACKRLIKNAIVCWNYMYLTKMLANESNPKKKVQLLIDIKRSSILSWGHFNFAGVFDFSDNTLKDSIGFKISELLKVKIPNSDEQPIK